tara:strand:+ start:728 stop:2113 length:1386 start_codon:yes stop_codon:yes gene_type:complete
MSTLTGSNIKDTYKMLLKTATASGFNITSTTNIEDGNGRTSALSLGKNHLNVAGKFSINSSNTAGVAADFYISTSSTQSVLIESSSGHDKLYVGDSSSVYNFKAGDIDSASPGNNNYLYIEDNQNRISLKSTYVGIGRTAPTAMLHVGDNSGTAVFALGGGTSAFKVGGSSNANMLSVDTTNSQINTSSADLNVKDTSIFRRSSGRYYLEEFFDRRPAINEDLDDTDTEAEFIPANKHFEIVNTTGYASNLVDWGGDYAGIKLTTGGTDNNSIVIAPHLNQLRDSQYDTAWSGILWGTENQVEWECAITTGSTVGATAFWAGLKLTNAPAFATDNDKAYFLYAADDDHGTLGDNTKLHFIYSRSGTDYVTNLGLAVAADTTYRLRISIGSDRKVSIFINDVQYGLTSTGGTSGTTEGTSTTKSLALTDNIDLIPYVGVQCHTGSARHIYLHYQKISRILFE